MATKTQTTLDNVALTVREAGEDGILIKDVATKVGVSVDSARKAAKVLEEKGVLKRDPSAPGKVIPILKVGRRSVDVVERDDKILAFIKEAGPDGASLADAAEHAGCTPHLAYESAWRLRKQGLIVRKGSTRQATWAAA